jgi:SAM-dependent methyltransferase
MHSGGESCTAAPPSPGEARQQPHYDRIAHAYQAHHGDRYSLAYRDRFIHRHLFRGNSLAGKRVLDAACGSGETTEYLLAQGAEVTGLDISHKQIEAFRRKFPAADAVCRSIFSTGFADATFDCVSVVGGLHHLHPDVQKAVDEIHRILQPGGRFCFFEPPSRTLPDLLRKVWYRCDKGNFEENEASIDARELLRQNRGRFRPRLERYGGNVAYLLVLQSMELRVPLGLKRLYAPPLMLLERALGPLQPRWLSCYVICQWEKIGGT